MRYNALSGSLRDLYKFGQRDIVETNVPVFTKSRHPTTHTSAVQVDTNFVPHCKHADERRGYEIVKCFVDPRHIGNDTSNER
jgi:hypothetical protein